MNRSMLNATLLEHFLFEEFAPDVPDRVRDGLEAGRSGTGPRRLLFEFNRFEITLDLDTDEALIQDVLDTSEAGTQRVPLPAFVAALTAHRPEKE